MAWSGKAMGALVSSWRASAGLSQSDLADALSLQQPAISKIETGQSSISVQQLMTILDVCGLKLSDVAVEMDLALGGSSRPIWERLDD